MPLTNTQEVYEIRSISPQVINPSIMEGRFLTDSTLGKNRAVRITRYAPIFLTAPLLTGDPGIPSTLFCSTGAVDASPVGYRHYQWFVDGVPDIEGDGVAFAYFTTSAIHDAKEITCEVTAINLLGEASAMSNGIVVSLIEPVIVGEYHNLAITGISADESITVFMDQIAVLTGMWVDDFVTVFQDHVFAITGTAKEDHIEMNFYDVYTAEFVELLDDISMNNPGAESGTGSWTVDAGALRQVASSTASGGGSYVFMGTSATSVDTQFHRDVDIPSTYYDEVDTGTTSISLNFYACLDSNSDTDDEMSATISFLDGSDVVTDTHDFFGIFLPKGKNRAPLTNQWGFYNTPTEQLPVGTRKIRITFWIAGRNRVDGSYCQIDQVSLQLFQPI